MYKNKKILALIPARGGSKGIKNKNIFPLNGYPLISYSIKASLKSKFIDETIVSTDDYEIAEVSKKYGADVPFMRPVELASDTSKTVDAVIHAIKTLESQKKYFDVLVLLQPTQPLRISEDIDKAIEKFFENDMTGLVSISQVEEHPLLMRTINTEGKLSSLLNKNSTCRRQDMENFYIVNGCIYINKISEISSDTSFNDNSIGFLMPSSRSIDIDEVKDIRLAEYYIKTEAKNVF